tara:strand:+ start:9417 stop:10682 length:1266 start_codon:yes stop_codon:yes gene_type:complete
MQSNKNITKFYLQGDKSIAIRSLILCLYFKGKHKIKNLPNSDDIKSTLYVFDKIGMDYQLLKNSLFIDSTNIKFNEIEIDCNESGTTARLLIGFFSGININCKIIGRKTLRKRPMDRVIFPLLDAGVNIQSKDNLLPVNIFKSKKLKTINATLIIPSAQIKSSLILYAMSRNGKSIISGNIKTRDHLERMLLDLKYPIKVGKDRIEIVGNKNKSNNININLPGDISSASFLICAALLSKESSIIIKDVCLNRYRMGFLESVIKMGGNIKINNKRNVHGENIGDIHASYTGNLKGITIDKINIPSLIDEIPVISILCLYSNGKTTFKNVEELRVKESDRIKAIIENIKLMNGNAKEIGNDLIIYGNKKLHNTTISDFNDHRIFMSFYIANKIINKNYRFDNNVDCYKKSFPDFLECIDRIIK